MRDPSWCRIHGQLPEPWCAILFPTEPPRVGFQDDERLGLAARASTEDSRSGKRMGATERIAELAAGATERVSQ
jgi:hypothetical protein